MRDRSAESSLDLPRTAVSWQSRGQGACGPPSARPLRRIALDDDVIYSCAQRHSCVDWNALMSVDMG